MAIVFRFSQPKTIVILRQGFRAIVVGKSCRGRSFFLRQGFRVFRAIVLGSQLKMLQLCKIIMSAK
ncbi:MAG: hypothetical protein KGQ16_07995 [Cyanobacteria bacterium REEB444]|nr:hypothetical protein [Cyanobacteria bacterium REEB444]